MFCLYKNLTTKKEHQGLCSSQSLFVLFFLKSFFFFFNLFFSFLKISWPWWQNTCILTTLFGSAGYKKCFRYIWLAKSLYRQCLCFSVFFYSNLHLLQLSCSNTKTMRSAVICVFAVAVWIHLVVLWLCDRGRGSAHTVGLALRFFLFQTKTGPFPSLKSQNVKCEQNDNNDEKWKPTCYCWRVKDWPDWLPPGLFFLVVGGGQP